jgi:sulfatase maturation enzyme AslB (radical SAM superfamily)
MKMKKLEITRELERMKDGRGTRGSGNPLGENIAIVNLPAPFYCDKGCRDCCSIRNRQVIITEQKERLPIQAIREIIGYFAENHGTRFITINGRGDPFHARVKAETLDKVAFAGSLGIRSYVFTAGDTLDETVCRLLACHEANVMLSLFGNGFIDAGLFGNRRYDGGEDVIAENLRMLMKIYAASPQPEDGTTRLGMNYVVSEGDLRDAGRLHGLKAAANEHGIFFVCNTTFMPHPDPETRGRLSRLARENSDFGMNHSTCVDGVCQMGAGSAVTVAADGRIYRCPYMLEGAVGNITELAPERMEKILAGWRADRRYACVIRRTVPAE